MTFYKTLDEALLDIASRSLYEDATMTPTKIGFTVEDNFSTAYAGDTIPWTHDGGMELPADISDNSRLHDPAEYYDGAHHIRYNLPAAVEALEAGHAVTFAYAIVEDLNCFDGSGDALTECEDCQCDRTVGWTLLAYDHGPMASAVKSAARP